MITRRQFVSAAAGAAAFACAFVPKARAAGYDLIVKGGRVIDPSVGLDAVRDVAIAAGRIAAVEPNITGETAAVIDARGKIVAPGLIDIHTHAARSKEGPPLALHDYASRTDRLPEPRPRNSRRRFDLARRRSRLGQDEGTRI